jgi:hypothetical protein
MVPRNLRKQHRNVLLNAVFDIQMHYGDAATSLLTWSRILQILLISQYKIGIERTRFWVSRRYPVFCNAGLKRHRTKCVPGLLQRMEMVCEGTRDVLWTSQHCSWWINKVKRVMNQPHYFIVRQENHPQIRGYRDSPNLPSSTQHTIKLQIQRIKDVIKFLHMKKTEIQPTVVLCTS